MDVIAYQAADKAVKRVKELNDTIVAPLAESRFTTVDARLDWLELQATKVKATNSQMVDLAAGTFVDTELMDGKIQLKTTGINEYATSGTYESPVVDLGEGWMDTKLVEVVKGSIAEYTNAIPVMTSNTAPSPYVISASSVYSATYAAWKAFDGSTASANGWLTPSGQPTGWLQVNFGSPKIIGKYAVTSRNSNLRGDLKDWTFEGSQDGVTWTVLDIHSNTPAWTATERREYVIANTASYQYYRINVTAITIVGDNYVSIGELEMLEKLSETHCDLEISTSTDGTTFTPYAAFDPFAPPSTRYVKFKATLSSTPAPVEPTALDFTQEDTQNTFVLGTTALADGTLRPKVSYVQTLDNPVIEGTGTIISTTIDKSQFKNVEKVSVS